MEKYNNTRENIKAALTVIGMVLGAYLLIAIIYLCIYTYTEYTVKLIFCDNRKPIVITFRDTDARNVLQIDNTKLAAPYFKGYYNVCEVQLIEKKAVK